jgi:HEPN domain-containing protein
MPPDDARLQDARAWLSKAELDLKAAAHEMAAEGLWADVMFHAQQAAEKSMKAFLAWHDVPFRKTHNLEELGQQCVSVDAGLAPMRKRCWRPRGTCTRRSWPECHQRRDHEPAARPAAQT